MNTENSIDQLKFFLKEMFQFNANDLDFGIYKIYNLKRKEIENFIDGKDEKCLEPIINKILELVKNIEKQVELKTLYAFLKESNKQNLLNDPAGNFEKIQQLIINFGENDSEKENLTTALNASTKEFNITDEIKDKIYNHILGYFEMYYSNGDFGYNNRSQNLYKVPYEADYDGNDTMFHWKHKGSLYIKTGNSFNTIKFKLKHLDKEFELRLETNAESKDEEVAHNNNKDTKLKHYKLNRFEENDGITRIVFNLSDSSTTKADLFKAIFKQVFINEIELTNYLFVDGKSVFNDLTDDYDKVQDGSVKGIGALRVNRKSLLNKVNKNFERGSKIEIITENGQERFSDKTLETLYNIDQKLNSFYIGNDSDYFIHENLQEFLTQEKERYIKNHILNDLKSILDGKLDNTTIIIAKAFDLVSNELIKFLSAIEEFQKKLFTMKKKVVESEYCLTIDNIDEKFYPEILENKVQIVEWETLFNVNVKTLADLKAQPILVLDTKFFKQKDGSNSFKDNILAEIENLDERTNGLLINSENYQGLKTISDRYNGQINCIHIDPPYNSNTSGFLYKNHFRHSSWISMMENRLSLGMGLLSKDGDFLCHIDENEYENLHQLMNQYKIGNAGTLIWDKRNPMNGGSGLALQHEYVLWNTNRTTTINFRNENAIVMLKMANKLIVDAGGLNDNVRKEFSKWISGNKDLTGGDKAYRYIDNKGQVYQSVSLRAPEPRTDDKFFQPLIHPLTKKPCAIPPNGFSRTPETLKKMMENNEILFGPDETTQPRQKVTLNSEVKKQMPSVIQDAKKGKSELAAMGLTFPYNHSTTLYEKLIGTSIGEIDGLVIDFFAGSGTSGHAVININKIGGRSIRFILIEMGTYFSSITKPRIIKSIFSSKWKAKKPVLGKGSSNQIIKYICIEQYEDILDAIEQFEGEMPKNLPLKYLYNPELNKINSTLDLSKPFNNKIKYGQPTKEGFVDLVDTYNYLQGYEVKSIKTYSIGKKYYKVVETSDNLVVWRDIYLGEDDSKAIIEIAEKYSEVTQIEVNYDFDILATLKDKQLEVGKRLLQLNIIHADVFNQ
jgi:adenine-specific DNA-methyltransferase